MTEDDTKGADQISKQKIWELPIYEIKYVDPIKGMSFRVGQHHRGHTINSIIRDVIDGEVLYLVFGEKDGETKLLKSTSGIAVYLTYEV